MRTNWVREKLRAGQPTIGCFLAMGSPNVAELLAHMGFDWLVIETEHNGLDSAEIEHMLMAMNGTDTIPIVRIPSSNPVFIQRALDMGAMGILVPMVKTAAEAAAIVRASRYPPAGSRSFGPIRALLYAGADYPKHANDTVIAFAMIETRQALDNLDDILSVDGLDAIYVGPADLSLALGCTPKFDQEEKPVVEAIEMIAAKAKEKGVVAGIHNGTPAYALRMIEHT